MDDFRVWVSRRFWPWPKKYRCKGMVWCSPQINQTPEGILLLILPDETRVFIDTRNRIITYGPEFHFWQAKQVAKEAGQIPS